MGRTAMRRANDVLLILEKRIWHSCEYMVLSMPSRYRTVAAQGSTVEQEEAIKMCEISNAR